MTFGNFLCARVFRCLGRLFVAGVLARRDCHWRGVDHLSLLSPAFAESAMLALEISPAEDGSCRRSLGIGGCSLLPSSWASRPPRVADASRQSTSVEIPQPVANAAHDGSPADNDDNVNSLPPVIESPQTASSSPQGNELAQNEPTGTMPAGNEPAGKNAPSRQGRVVRRLDFRCDGVPRHDRDASSRGARRWRRDWRLVKDREILGLNEHLSEDLGLFQPPVLFEAETCLSPVVFGAVRTSIVLPSPLLAQSSPSRLRMILAHEMAHIRRGDLLGNWFSTLITGLFFFHPLVWLALRESRLAQEVACDELVSRRARRLGGRLWTHAPGACDQIPANLGSPWRRSASSSRFTSFSRGG